MQQIEIIKPKGSWFWLIVWILLLWPVAVVYYFMRSW